MPARAVVAASAPAGATSSMASSRVHIAFDASAPTVLLAKPQTNQYGFIDDASTGGHSAIHFRDQLPSLFYTIRGSRLVLVCLDTSSPPTVIECGSQIVSVGVHDDSSNAIVHVFLANGLLYSMILTPRHLENPLLQREEGWVTEFAPPSFQIRQPLYMQSVSASTIIFALADGGLLRLSNNGRGYNEHVFADATYFGSLRSILPWSGRSSNTVVSIRAVPSRDRLFTVSVDGQLKVWSLKQGTLLAAYSTYGADYRPSHLEDAVQKGHLAVAASQTALHVATYHRESGTFKIHRSQGEELVVLREMTQEEPLEGIWRVFDLSLRVDTSGTIWLYVLWKFDTLTLVQIAQLSQSGKLSWSFVHTPLADPVPESSSDAVADYAFDPSLFSLATLREAVARVFSDPELVAANPSHRELRDATVAVIRQGIPIDTDHDTGAYLADAQEDAVRTKLIQLAKVCRELDHVSAEPFSIATSTFTGEALVAMNSQVLVLRNPVAMEHICRRVGSSFETTNMEFDHVVRAYNRCFPLQGQTGWQNTRAIFASACLQERTLSADDAMFFCHELISGDHAAAQLMQTIAETVPPSIKNLKTLSALLPHLRLSLKDGGDSVLSLDAYTATQYDGNRQALSLAELSLLIVLSSACSDLSGDSFAYAGLFLSYIDTLRQSYLLRRLLSTTLPQDRDTAASAGMTTDLRRLSVADDSAMSDYSTERSVSERTIFRALGNIYDLEVPSRNLVEHVLVLLVNRGQGKLGTEFATYSEPSCLTQYLVARALLLDGQLDQAMQTFLRTGPQLVREQQTKAERYLKTRLHRGGLRNNLLHAAELFTHAGHASHALQLCEAAKLASACSTDEAYDTTSLYRRIFDAALASQQWDDAYSALAAMPVDGSREALEHLVNAMAEQGQAARLISYPYIGRLDELDLVLEHKALNMLDVRLQPQYHKVLYALRMQRGQLRAAACILYQRLQVLRNRSRVHGFSMPDHLLVTEDYLAVLAALRCLPKGDDWIIVAGSDHTAAATEPQHKKSRMDGANAEQRTQHGGHTESRVEVTRKLLSLADVKREYEAELKNMSAQLHMLMEG